MYDTLLKSCDDYIISIRNKITDQINGLGENIFNYTKSDYTNLILNKYKYFEIALLKTDVKYDILKFDVLGEYFNPGYDVESTKYYKRDFVVYNIKVINGEKLFKSNINLLHNYVNSAILYGANLEISICSYEYDLKASAAKLEEIKKKAQNIIYKVNSTIDEINIRLKGFSNNLENLIKNIYEMKINEERQKKSAFDKLNPFE